MGTAKNKIIEGMVNLSEISLSIYNLKQAHKKFLAENSTIGDKKAVEVLSIINSLSALRSDIDKEVDNLINQVYFLDNCLALEV